MNTLEGKAVVINPINTIKQETPKGKSKKSKSESKPTGKKRKSTDKNSK